MDLNRQFRRLQGTEESLDIDDPFLLEVYRHLGDGLTWEDLLQKPCVVVLGEAGTGKTVEFRLATSRLRSRGKHAFFVSIEDLAEGNWHKQLTAEDAGPFHAWRAQEKPGYFFLDALDEAKLQRHSLEHALRELRINLDRDLSRASIFLSCRATDWLPHQDRDALRRLVGEKLPVEVVELAPLTRLQVVRLAVLWGLLETDVNDLVGAVDEVGARFLIERPRDVEWACRYWRSNKKLDRIETLIEHNIGEKLTDSARGSSLSIERAREGATTLAGIMTLAGKFTIRLPDHPADAVATPHVVAAKAALLGWSDVEIRELLTLPIFDEATYGRARFHHRSVQEFLSAKWLATLLDHGLPIAKLIDLLFRRVGGTNRVPKYLQATAAWLCLREGGLRRRCIEIAPEILLDEADPVGLPLEDRKAVLSGFLRKYRTAGSAIPAFDGAGLRRFATPALGSPVSSFLKRETADELRSILLRLAAYGRMAGCVEPALDILRDSRTSPRLRHAAMATIASAGIEEQRRQALRTVQDLRVLDADMAGVFLRTCYPTLVDETGVLDIVSAIPEGDDATTSLDVFLGSELATACPPQRRLTLAARLVGALDASGPSPPTKGKRFGRLLKALLAVLTAVVEDAPGSAHNATLVLSSLDTILRLEQTWPTSMSTRKTLSRISSVSPQLRRAMFWHVAAQHRSSKGRVPTRYFKIAHRLSTFDPVESDFHWLTEDAKRKHDVCERLLAFDTLLCKMSFGAANRHAMGQLSMVAEHDPALRKRLDRSLIDRGPQHPSQRRFERERRVDQQRQDRQTARSRSALLRRIEPLRQGMDLMALEHLYQVGSEETHNFGDLSLERIEETYGSGIANAAASGFRAFWKSHWPLMPHERAKPNQTPLADVIGLAGLMLTARSGLETEQLSEDDVVRATRYGTVRLSSFPEFVDLLASRFPDLVGQALRPALEAELHGTNSQTSNLGVLSLLTESTLAVRRACSGVLRELLSGDTCVSILAIDAVAKTLEPIKGEELSWLASLARGRSEKSVAEPEAYARWWSIWADRTPEEAVEFLERVGRDCSARAETLVMEVCARLESLTGCGLESHSGLRAHPSALSRLIPIVYSNVRRAEDQPAEGAFCPGSRGRAQRLRGQLVSWLTTAAGHRSEELLRSLAEDPRLLEIRKYLLQQADENALVLRPWTVQECHQWSSTGTRSPASAESLFEMVLLRLQEIRHFLATDSFSPRSLFSQGGKPAAESEFQKWIACELERRSHNHFSVTREEEANRNKNPDILLRSQVCAEPVVIEVKVAERWSHTELERALCSQLGEDYLKSSGRSFGILLLCSAGEPKKWKTRQGFVDFAGLVRSLADVAAGHLPGPSTSPKLCVFGIGFH
ncbi:MAG: hypothetical protein HYZ53_06985 [Planctomycetes bacterium]|nr:hypothetical protein [Planctomycetota bacterium]